MTLSQRYRPSLAGRVTLLATIAVGISVAVVALAAFITVRVSMMQTLDDSLLTRASRAASSDTLGALTSQSVPSWALGAADVRIIFVNTRTQTISTPDRGPAFKLTSAELDVANGRSDYSLRTVVAEGGARYRLAAVPVGQDAALILAQSLEPNDKVLERLGAVMLLVGLAGVVAATLAGWAVARNGLRPVRRLTRAAEDIARTEQLDPIPVEGNDELARLATSFNAMLAALAASRDRQRQLVADAGHELRTPMTSLRTNLDLLIQADGGTHTLPAESRQELLADVRAQLGELTTLVGDLVELARDEPLAHTVEPLDLADIVESSVARVRRRAPGLHFAVTCDPWWVVGEAGAVERAVTNLLDNAAKWSPPLGRVRVELAEGTLTVGDEGPGIDETDLPHVFDRFYRSPESRPLPGSGLGLSIVRQVAERHGGSVQAGTNDNGGARFTLRLPGSATTPPPVDAATSDGPEGSGATATGQAGSRPSSRQGSRWSTRQASRRFPEDGSPPDDVSAN